MTDTLITFITAKLAKEKGFNIPTSIYINKRGEILENRIKHTNTSLKKVSLDVYGKVISCCTQSLLQKWLREQYGIYVLINYVGNGKFNWEINGFQHGEYGIGFKGTYEEALEEGLKQALKLI